MINLAPFRTALAARTDMTPVTATIAVKSAVVKILRVSADDQQAEVRWPDGTIETLLASEIESLSA